MVESIAQIFSQQQQKNHFFEVNNWEIRGLLVLFGFFLNPFVPGIAREPKYILKMIFNFRYLSLMDEMTRLEFYFSFFFLLGPGLNLSVLHFLVNV